MPTSKAILFSSLIALGSLAASAQAHFPWLIRNEDGKAVYFFGEDISDRNYKLPPSIATAKVHRLTANAELEPVALSPIETDDLVGLVSTDSVAADAMLASQVTFGIYHGSRLEYYTVHQGGPLPTHSASHQHLRTLHDLTAEIIDSEEGIEVTVYWKDQPLKDIEVHLYGAEGHEEGVATTDPSGKVAFSDKLVEEGLHGIMLGYTVNQPGKLKGSDYESTSHYLTATFSAPDSKHKQANAMQLPPLPFAITSFGAARLGDSLYVYGGHTGEAHSYSNRSQSNKLLKLDLRSKGAGWEEVVIGERIQGLGMVAYQQQLILIGGFTALNEEGSEHDLHSQAAVRAFDSTTGKWNELPALPEPRSSHDAAIIDSTVHVVGGWKLAGDGDTTWHSTAWAMDLSAANPQWTPVPQPPFQRRALASVAHDGKLFAIGGMNETGGPTKEVHVYDPQSETWTEVGELLGDKAMAGFGVSGWSIDGKLVVTTYEGTVQQWDESTQSWKLVGKSDDARFFHRILPLNENALVAIGGANMESGKFLELETIPTR